MKRALIFLSLVFTVSMTGCASSKMYSRTYDSGRQTGGQVLISGTAPQSEADALMDSACGPSKWAVVREEQEHPNKLGNIAASTWARLITFVCK